MSISDKSPILTALNKVVDKSSKGYNQGWLSQDRAEAMRMEVVNKLVVPQ